MWTFHKLRLLSWSSPALHFFFLTIVTFGILAPLTCHHLLHSYFYARHWHLDRMSKEFLEQSLKEGEAALHYFEKLQARNFSLPHGERASSRPWLVITIITVYRQPEFHYVLQVVSGFHRLLQQCGPPCRSYQLFLCNVDWNSRHQDATLLANFIPVTSRFANSKGPNISRAVFRNTFEKEKQDYAYCLEKSLQNYNPEYILMVEDDALPEEQIFSVLRHLLETRFSEPHLRNALYLKLYHPERLQHYFNPEPMRILEWFGVGMFLGPLLGWAYVKIAHLPVLNYRIVLFFSLYSMGLVELVGRHYLLELRRLAPALYNVVPTTQCCTPAMLFPASSAQRTVNYLAEISCRNGFAKDMALYSFLQDKNEKAYVVEPNLVRHIGLFSSLRLNYKPKLL
ncbi:transmembrane protein 246 [Sarcophilus harrisii]|uniref:Post-GPI attachment to proteins GalNAc transferase 4 n=1 Tax=Sarcophilus harrisii TaxID=9305 RepID=G3WEP8_SARHA|nr:transmembrane protein 246 [Sarcophilus harrisii]XP_023353739.1 transmembrane protein 246 [Sarcophilus harrisii]XP_031817148.1 transmembrane protein 246 [Sarcophilus harrisii]XP_031817151.1 transmembrane protein 246 [Sarcophilus harrisii]